MKRRIISFIVVFVMASIIVCSQAFVVDTKAVSDGMTVAEMADAIKDGVKHFRKKHIKNDDGSRTLITENFKKTKKTKKRNNLPSSYVAPYTSVKDQNVFGACWMFGEMGSVESNLMHRDGYPGGLQENDPIDLSEAQGIYVQYNKQTKQGTISGETYTDSSNDSEKYTGSYYGYMEGGWIFDATMSVTADKGVAYESENPYLSTDSSTRDTDSKTMAQTAAAQYRLNRFNIDSAVYLPEVFPITEEDGVRTREFDSEAREVWKQYLLNNGAFSANYYQSNSSIYNRTWGRDASEYEIGPNFWMHDANARSRYSTNHTITVVGYNDDYSRYHYITKYTNQSYDQLVGEIVYIKLDENNDPDMTFNADGSIDSIQASDTAETGYQAYIVPKEDGSWFIKNSYGTGEEGQKRYDDGIMCMSFCEQTLSEVVATTTEENLYQVMNNERNYDTTLTHSSLMGNSIPSFDPEIKAAEIYSIDRDKDIELEKIGYWTDVEDTVSNFKIYGILTDRNDPESGTLLYDSGDVFGGYPGYHSHELDEAITLTHGTNVSVVISQTCDDTSALVIEAEKTSNIYYLINCKTNDTKYFNGVDWIDAKELDEQAREQGVTVGNSTVKMFGNAKSIEPETTTAPKYTVSVDGVETEVEEGQTFTFPNDSENGFISADYSTLYANGQTITPEDDITAVSIPEIDFNMQNGASVDLQGRDGIRFGAIATCTDSDILNSANIEFGTLITPHDIFIDDLEEELDLETFDEVGMPKVFKIVNSGWDRGVVGNFAAGIINLKSFNWNRSLIARSYMILKYSDGSSKVIYTGFSPTRSIKKVVENLRDMGYPGLTEEQIAMLQKYLD